MPALLALIFNCVVGVFGVSEVGRSPMLLRLVSRVCKKLFLLLQQALRQLDTYEC